MPSKKRETEMQIEAIIHEVTDLSRRVVALEAKERMQDERLNDLESPIRADGGGDGGTGDDDPPPGGG